MTVHLPEAFADLEAYADYWSSPDEGERFQALVNSTVVDVKAFYEAILPRVREAKKHLEQFDFRALPASEERLLNLLIAFMESAHVIELKWSTTDIDDPFPASRVTFGNTRPASAL